MSSFSADPVLASPYLTGALPGVALRAKGGPNG